MFEDEADTISIDPDLYTVDLSAAASRSSTTDLTARARSEVDAFEVTSPHEVHARLEPVEEELDDTDLLLINSKPIEEASVTDVNVGRNARPSTNADWPPPPKQPARRSVRRAGIYRAISSITKLNALKP